MPKIGKVKTSVVSQIPQRRVQAFSVIHLHNKMPDARAHLNDILRVIERHLFFLASSNRLLLCITVFQVPLNSRNLKLLRLKLRAPKSVEPKNPSPTPQLFVVFQTHFAQQV